MNYYVCLQILICRNLKIFRRHEKPVRPYERFSYVRLYSLKRNLFLMILSQNRNWNLDLNRRCFLILSRLCRYLILIFLSLNLSLNWNGSLIPKIFFHLRERLHHPYGQFLYVQICSSMRNLSLKFRYLKKTCRFRLI